ncbi:4'-phosphopantetheinyl transferase [Schistosoma bovis]|uniref:holo-[acyl-carrier-protein] synthase n=1 Tax=Schistosoma bovis TaxID=6184 RepID=A0A430QHR1_SCHBO|nr:4'-phosphopantetheinyl transferase [Schistosoma bovis]
MVGKLLIRGTAVRYLKISPHDVKLERSPEGRPYILGYSDVLDFNISHGGDFTIIAATPVGRCGADVMPIELPGKLLLSVNDFVLKMKDVFSSTEVNRILSSGSEAEKMRKFYEHWETKTSTSFSQLTFEQLVDKLAVLSPVDNTAWDQFLRKPHSPPSSRQRIQVNQFRFN